MEQIVTKKNNRIFAIVVICIVLILTNLTVVSFADPTTKVEPTENQYLELRAVNLIEAEGKNTQIIMELWGHEIEMKAFNVRFSYDSTKINPSAFTTNDKVTDIVTNKNDYFQFVTEFAGKLDFLQMSETAGFMDMTISYNPPIEESEHIIDKRRDNRKSYKHLR